MLRLQTGSSAVSSVSCHIGTTGLCCLPCCCHMRKPPKRMRGKRCQQSVFLVRVPKVSGAATLLIALSSICLHTTSGSFQENLLSFFLFVAKPYKSKFFLSQVEENFTKLAYTQSECVGSCDLCLEVGIALAVAADRCADTSSGPTFSPPPTPTPASFRRSSSLWPPFRATLPYGGKHGSSCCSSFRCNPTESNEIHVGGTCHS